MTCEHETVLRPLRAASSAPLEGATEAGAPEVQPHGVLLVLRGDRIAQVSANVHEHLGMGANQLLGAPIERLVEGGWPAPVAAAIAAGEPLQVFNPLGLRVGPEGRPCDGILHRVEGALLLDLEPAGTAVRRRHSHRQARRSLQRMQATADMAQLLQVAAEEVRELTGMHRVSICRFHEDGHCEVVTESRAEALPSLLGTHYPSDAVRPATEALLRRDAVRAVPHVAQRPVPLLPLAAGGAPLDLTPSTLCAASPLHLAVLANMGVGAAVSFALSCNGALWGLVVCHHRAPCRVPYEARAACAFLGQMLSWQVGARADADTQARRLRAARAQGHILAAVGHRGDVARALVESPAVLLQLVDAAGAAVSYDGELHTCGQAPRPAELRALLTWLASLGRHDAFHSECLSADYLPALAFAEQTCGLVAVPLGPTPGDLLVWFRGEQPRTEIWAPGPAHRAAEVALGGALTAREVRLHCAPWSAGDLLAAADLQQAVMRLIVSRVAEITRLNGHLREAVQARDDFLSLASHELKTPLATLALQVENLQRAARRAAGDLPLPPTLLKLDRMLRQTERLGELIDSMLDVSRISAGCLSLRCEAAVDVSRRVREVAHRHRDTCKKQGRELRLDIEAGIVATCDPLRLEQVVNNLVTNAIKYGEDGPVEVRLHAASGRFVLEVRDEGIGVAPAMQGKIFGRFARGVASTHYQGLGLGLWIVSEIVAAHGGEVTLRSVLGGGSTFSVWLPNGADVAPAAPPLSACR